MVAIGVALLVLVLVAAAVALVGLPQLGPRQTPAPAAPAAPSGSAPSAGASAATEPAGDAAWWRVRLDRMAMNAQTIDVGTLEGGVTATVQVAMQPPPREGSIFPNRNVIGPMGGQVVTIGADGGDAVLIAIDAVTGEMREVIRTGDMVVDAAFTTGSTVVFITADRLTGDLTGAWLVDVMNPDEPERVDGLLAAEPAVRLVARSGTIIRLLVSADGSSAAVLQCEMDACVVNAVSFVDGSRHQRRVGFGEEPIGIDGELLVLRPTCAVVQCIGEALDLATGERRRLPGDGWQIFSEAFIASDQGPLLIGQETGSIMPAPEPVEDPSFSVIDLDDFAERGPIPVAGLGSMRIMALPAWDLGVELPSGWFGVLGSAPVPEGESPNVLQTVFAVEAATGRVVPLPALGEVLTEG
jgi:hypothetical protein